MCIRDRAYFQYDSKKTGGVTISHLRFGDKPIRSPYYINKADFVACHNPSYIVKGFPMVRDVKPGGTFLINCQWSAEDLDKHMPAVAKRYIAANNIQVYTIDAIDLAAKIGMGKRTNTILQSAFFKLAKVMPEAEAIGYMKDAATHSYLKKGQDVVDMNHKAIDMGATAFKKFTVPASWATAVDEKKDMQDNTVKGSQFRQPMLEFSGSCAGCAETSYARLITQVCGDRMYISNATGCSSIWGGPAATSPYTVNKAGHGPAWANSLFEDNAEHGLGFYYGQKALRDRLTEQTKALIAIDYADESIKTAGQAWLDTMADGTANAEATKAYVAALEAVMAENGDCGCDACKLAREILSHKEFLMNEARYSALTRAFPDRAEKLFKENEELAKARYEHLVKLQELYA